MLQVDFRFSHINDNSLQLNTFFVRKDIHDVIDYNVGGNTSHGM